MKRISMVRIDAQYWSFPGILSSISEQIRLSLKAQEREHDENGDVYAFYKELTAALIGSAFVVCQTRISRVVKAIQDHQTGGGKDLKTIRAKDYEIRAQGMMVPKNDGKNFSQAQVIWEIANYFKHADEWPHDWAEVKGDRQKRTISAISAAGLSAAKSYVENIHQGADFFGTDDGRNLEELSRILKEWESAVISLYCLD